MKKLLIALCFTAAAAAFAEIEIKISADPALPAANIIAQEPNIDFSEGMKHWKTEQDDVFSIVSPEDLPGKKAVFVSKSSKGGMRRYLNRKLFTPGKSYICTCMIKPSADATARTTVGSGLGFNVTYWDKSWKKGEITYARGQGNGSWQRVVSKPLVIHDWINRVSLMMNLAYSPKGSGYIADLAIMEAETVLKIEVSAPENIRQIKVVDDMDRTLFDSGILNNAGKSFVKELTASTAYSYIVMVITGDGDVKSVTYPEK